MHECPPILLNNRHLVFILKGFYWMQNKQTDSTFMGSYIFQFSPVYYILGNLTAYWPVLEQILGMDSVWKTALYLGCANKRTQTYFIQKQ